MEIVLSEKDIDKFEAPPFLLNPKNLGAALNFESYEEIQTWAENERDFWQSLNGLTADAQNWGDPIAAELMGNYQNLLSSAQRAETDGGHQNRVRNIFHAIERGDWPVSEDAVGQVVKNLITTDPHRAIAHAALAFNAQFGLQHSTSTILNAFMDAKLDSLINQAGVDAREETLTNLRKRWDGRYRSIEARHNRLLDQADEAFLSGKKIARKVVRKSAKQMAAHKSRMTTIEEAFKTKIAVQAADTYWGDRLLANHQSAETARSWFVGVGAIGLLVTLAIVVLAASILPDNIDVTKFSTLQMIVFGLPTLIYVWLLRITVGRWKRHISLKEDAEQRLSMLSTFLALEAGGDATKEERILMLSALFRSHDEAAEEEIPNPVVNAVLKRVTKP